jgi:hypothetical protein
MFTTKIGGMGMGLSISRSIIAAHGGRIWASPGESVGAIFRIVLPSERSVEGDQFDRTARRSHQAATWCRASTLRSLMHPLLRISNVRDLYKMVE